MKKGLVDLNVVLDFLARRENHAKAAEIFHAIETKKLKGFLSVHEITTLAYFLEKEKKSKATIKTIIGTILDLFSILPITETILRKALDSQITDFEDAVLEKAAAYEKLDFIITNNIKDFKKGEIRAVTPEQFLGM